MSIKSYPLVFMLPLLLMFSQGSFGLPVNPQLISGQGDYQFTEHSLQINQQSHFMHSQFDQLNIASNESVNFVQPNAQSIAVAQVLDVDVTQVHGQLSANGQLFLVAPGGLIVHQGGSIEAGSLFVGAGHLASAENNELFIVNGSAFRNNGRIQTLDGSMSIFASTIENQGEIVSADELTVQSGDSVYVHFNEDLFSMEVQSAALDGMIENSGLLKSEGGQVQLQAHVREQFNETVIHNLGEISATGAWEEAGEIYLGANEGDIQNDGLITLENTQGNEDSSVMLEAQRIAHAGEINVSGSYNQQGGRIELLAEHVVDVRSGSVLQANGGISGDGGFIKVFSPQSALFRNDASIQAQGGLLSGDGGFVDVSGWEYIEINGRVSTLALNGINGQFLIDPYNVTISAAATNNDSFAVNAYTPSSNGATINVTELQNNLKLGNVTVVTTGAGAENGDISVAVAIDLDGTNGNTLELIADGSILLNGSITDGTPGSADATNVVMQALNGTITAGINTVQSGGGAIELKTNGNITLGAGGNLDLTKFDTQGGSLSLESTAGTLTLLGDIDLDGYNGNTINFKANGDLNLDFDVKDLTTASADAVNLGFMSTTGDVLIAGGKVVQSSGGAITIEAASNITVGTGGYVDLASFDSGGGNLKVESTSGSLTLLNDLDLNGRSGSILTLQADTDLNLNFNIADSVTGSADSVALSLRAGNDINIAAGKSVNSYGNLITFNANNNIALTNVSSGGGSIFLSAINITDAGDTGSGYDINAGGGLVRLNASGNIGGTAYTSAIEINNAILDITTSGTNQNVYLINNAATDLTINDVDYNGTGTFGFNVRTTSTGDLSVTGQVTDTVAGGDVATINFETQNAASDIILNGATVRSYGGDITYNSAATLGIVNTQTDGGALTITATDVYDNGGGVDINTQGGLVTFNVSGDVGVSGVNGNLEVQDSIITGTVGALNATWDLKSVAASSFLTLSNIDFNNANGFTLSALANGGTLNVTGVISDSDSLGDSATITLETSLAGSDIIMADGSGVYSNGGVITYNSADEIGLATTLSNGGAINITAAGNIYDNNTGDDLSSNGGLITINPTADVGGTGLGIASSIEIFDSLIDLNITNNNQSIYFNVDNTDSYLKINNVDYNGGDGLNLGVLAENGADIQITGNVFDSDPVSPDSASITITTSSVTGDITIDDGATIRSGSGGGITLNSANDIYLTGVLAGSSLTIISAANDIIDNGSITYDVSSSGVVNISAQGDVGKGVTDGALDIGAGTFNLTMGAGDWDLLGLSALNLNDIEINGANGSTLQLLSNSDINLTGVMGDSVGADDKIEMILGATSPGFIVFPNAGYTVLGGLTFWSGTNGIKDGADERVNITADSLTSSGTNFLGNANQMIWDLSVDTLDINDATGTKSFELYNDKDLTLLDSDGDGEFLLGKDFKISVNGNLTVPDQAMNDVDDQLWLIANDIDDPDADNIISINDSADAGSNFNLIIDLAGASDVQVNTDASQIDGSVAAGGILRIHPSLIANFSQDLNADGSLMNGQGDIFIESTADVVLADAGLQTNGNLSIIADDVYDSDKQLLLSANDVYFSALSPTSIYTLDLTAQRFDADVAADLTLNTSANLELADVDADGFTLENIQNFKLNSTASLLLPATGITTANSIWLNAVDVSDGDYDLTFTTADLYLATTVSNTAYQLNGGFNRFDYDLSGAQTDLVINVTGSLDLATYDGASDGSTLEGGRHFTVSTVENLLLKDGGISSGGDIDIQVAGELTTFSNQAIILSGANVSMQVAGATNPIEANLTASGNLLVDINSALVVQGGTLNVSGDTSVKADDVRSDTDRAVTLTGNRANINYVNQLADSIINAQVNEFDAQGGAGLVVNSIADLTLLDINGDGSALTGFQNIEVNVNGVLTLLDAGLQTSGDLAITADLIEDSDPIVQLSADRLFVDYQSPLANVAYGINGAFNEFNAAINGDLNLTVAGNVDINDWSGTGQLLSSLQGFSVVSSGTVSIPLTGLSAASMLWIEAVDLTDGNADLILNAPDVFFDLSEADKTFVISTTATNLDGNLTGTHSQLVVNAVSDLAIADINGDGNSLVVRDGYAYVDVKGQLTVRDSIEVSDAQNDGTVGGWLYLAYEGQADIGTTSAATIVADGSIESSVSGVNPDASAQIYIQQTGVLSATNSLSIGAAVQAVGGDIVLDITNGTNTLVTAGDIILPAGASLIAKNTQVDALSDLVFENFTPAGLIQAGGGSTVRINGYRLLADVPVIPEVPEDVINEIDDAVSDVINGSVGESDQIAAEGIQDETVAAVESTPNVNLALNEMFSGCRQSNEQESRCKVKEEISRFLGRFLIGGSMPKSK